jgi:hypothetical protein
MDVVGWLQSLGLERYAAAFRENEIDDIVLRTLTTEDLKELGFGPLGHRRKLLDAIATLRTDTSPKSAALDAVPIIDASRKDIAERRQVTVMLSRLIFSKGKTAIDGFSGTMRADRCQGRCRSPRP